MADNDDFFVEMNASDYRRWMAANQRKNSRQNRQIVYAYLDSPGLWYTSRETAQMENPARDPDTLEKFDSKTEHRRYCELHTLQRAGEIQNLKCHPTYILSAAESVSYTPDFTYTENGRLVAEDVKGVRNDNTKLVWAAARVKQAWFRHEYPDIEFRLTTA